MQVTRHHILVAHLLRSEFLIKRAIERLEPSDLAKICGSAMGFIWARSLDHFKQFDRLIPRHTLEADLAQWLYETHMDSLTIDETVEFVVWAYGVPENELNAEEALHYMKEVLEETRVRGPLVDALGNGMSAAEVLEIVQSGLTAATVTVGEPISPLSTLGELVGQKKPEPLGGSEIMYFNKMLNGGVLPGDIIVLLGPTGGFKTTMAVDIVCAMARMHEPSAYFLFEQAYSTGDMPLRFLARLTDIPRDRLGSTPLEQLLPEEQTKVIEAKTIEHFISIFDRTQKADRIEDVAEMVRQLCITGRKPKLVVIDQALAWIEGSQLITNERDDSMRKFLRSMVLRLKRDVAEKYGTAILLMHQVTAEKTSRSSNHKFSGNDSAECKSMPFWTDFEIVLCNVCETTRCLFGITRKTRRGPGQTLILRADGAVCRMSEAEDMELNEYTNAFVKKGMSKRVTQGMQGMKTDDAS